MIEKVYKEKFKELLTPMGFKISRKTFFKVVNDVVQTICLVKNRYDCSIGFDILPLSIGLTHLDIDGYSISMYREGVLKGWDWKFEPSEMYTNGKHIVFNDGSIEDIVDSMLSIVKAKVIPIFSRAIDCKSALTELEKHEREVYGEIQFTKVSQCTYLTYIKLKEYKNAYEFLARQITSEEEVIAHNVMYRKKFAEIIKNDETPEEYQNAAQVRLQEKRDELIKLSIPDAEYFQKMIADGERTSLELLKPKNRKPK